MKNTIDFLTKKIVEDYTDVLKLSFGDLKRKSIENSPEIQSINYVQTYKSLPVINSELGFSIDKEGNIISLGGDLYENIDLPIIPQVSFSLAASIAQNAFGEDNCIQEQNLVINPKIKNNANVFTLCWFIKLTSKKYCNSKTYLINANNAVIDDIIDNTREDFGGNVTISYWPLHPTDSPLTVPFANSPIRLYSISMDLITTSYTNSNGDYSMSAGIGPYFIIFPLLDDYGQVYDGQPTTSPIIENRKITGLYTQNKNWEISEGSNLKWHVRKVHDFYKNAMNYNSMDYIMEGHINSGSTINGKADGTNIFFGSDRGFYWVRNADVIYHEYTHNVIYHIYGGFIEPGSNQYSQANAMDEGLSDFFACDMTNDSQMSEGVDASVTRNLSNNLTWDATREGHYNGQVIGGACWDLRQSIGSSITEQLVFKALQLSPKARNFQDFLENLFLADYTLYNGTHHNSILTAFNNNNIQPIVVTSSITGPYSLSPYQTGTWTVSVSGGVPPYSYSWSYEPMCSGGGLSVAPCGYWYSLGVTTNTLSRYDTRDFEIKCDVTDAINQTTTVSQYISVSSSLAKGVINISEKRADEIPNTYELAQNYPNPFNPTTTIQYSILGKGYTSLKVYDVLGNLISTLVDETKNPGYYEVKFNGSTLPSGVYFCKLFVNNFTSTSKMLLIK